MRKLKTREDVISALENGQNSFTEWDLTGADLHGINFEKANLTGAVLREANLEGANLRKADLRFSILQKANLQNATLIEAD